MRQLIGLFLVVLISCVGCKKDSNPVQPIVTADSAMYFPPIAGNEWRANSAASLGWNQNQLSNTLNFLGTKGTKAFIILKNGRVVVEQYYGSFTQDSIWYWASAGKTMTAYLVGIAQKNGLININDRSSQYLGTGWG